MNRSIAISSRKIGKCYYDFHVNWAKTALSFLPNIKKFNEIWPLQNISFDVPNGATFGVTSQNKHVINVFLNILRGKIEPSCGKITINHKLIILSELLLENIKYNHNAPHSSESRQQKTCSTEETINFIKILDSISENNTELLVIFDEINFTNTILKHAQEYPNLIKTKKDHVTLIYATTDPPRCHAVCSQVLSLDTREVVAGSDRQSLQPEQPKKRLSLTGGANEGHEPVNSVKGPFVLAHPSAPGPAPIAVGGVGGSGTRLVAAMLKEAGIYIGDDLNKANDNLWFTLLFKQANLLECPGEKIRPLIDIFANGMMGRHVWEKEHVEMIESLASENRSYCSKYWLQRRAKLLLRHKTSLCESSVFGWKEPNTHLFLDHFKSNFPNLKYIHVYRNGLDMAYSKNQNQVNFWGRHFIPELNIVTPKESLKFWSLTNKRTIKFCNELNIDHLIVNFDKLCIEKKQEIKKIASFIGVNESILANFEKIIEKPKSLGRFKKYGIESFEEEDISYVASLGFEIN